MFIDSFFFFLNLKTKFNAWFLFMKNKTIKFIYELKSIICFIFYLFIFLIILKDNVEVLESVKPNSLLKDINAKNVFLKYRRSYFFCGVN